MIRARCGMAIAVTALLVTASAAQADVKSQERTQVKFEGMLGRMMNMFGGGRAKEGIVQTVAVKGDRKATMTQDSGTIVDLAEEKVYEVNLKDRSYKVVTFAELRRRMEEARAKAEEEARKAEAREKKEGEKEMEVDFSLKETGQTRTVNGQSCRQIVAVVGVHEKGKTLEASGGIIMTTDMWMAPAIAGMKEVADFEMRYVRKLGLDVAGAADMAQAMAMYPGFRDAMAKFQKERVNMNGTAMQTIMTVQTVMSPEQAAQAKKGDEERPPSAGGALGGLMGRFGRKKAPETKEAEAPASSAAASGGNKTTFMTSTHDLLSVTTSVTAADVEIPAGFRQK